MPNATTTTRSSSSSTTFHTLPDFPFTPIPTPPSALAAAHQFVATLLSSPSPPPFPAPPKFPDPVSHRSPPQEQPLFFSAHASPLPSSPSPSPPSGGPPPPPPQHPLASSVDRSPSPQKRSRSQDFERVPSSCVENFTSRRPSSSSLLLRRSQKLAPPASLLLPPSRPALILQGQVRQNLVSQPRRRSSWRRLKRMGNGIAAPFRSLRLCVTGGLGVIELCEDRSGSSSLGSSYCSSGEFGPEFVRSVLENNVLLYDRGRE